MTTSITQEYDESYFRLFCPITLTLMTDPVKAVDGHIYDRASITEWFKNLQEQRKPPTSPKTGLPHESMVLTPLPDLLREIQAYRAQRSSIQPQDIKFTLSSEIYQELDKLPSLLATLNLPNPQIIVIGNESHGKSSLLERIIGLPIFPRDKGLCTRCLIRVQLRRCAEGEVSLASVSVEQREYRCDEGETWVEQQRNRGFATAADIRAEQRRHKQQRNRRYYGEEEASFSDIRVGQQRAAPQIPVEVAPLDRIREVIKDKMDELRKQSPGKEIIDDFINSMIPRYTQMICQIKDFGKRVTNANVRKSLSGFVCLIVSTLTCWICQA